MLKINEGSESPILDVDEGGNANLEEAAGRRRLKEKEEEETVKAIRESAARHQEPWMKALPARAVLLTTYRSLAASRDMKPPQLIALANKLLTFLVKLEEHTSSASHRDIFFEEYVKVLDSLFVRLTSNPLQAQCKEEFESFVDFLWTTFKNGLIKFEGTKIPERLVNRYPSRLEQVMGPASESLQTIDENLSLDAVLPLCLGSSTNFMKVMGHLYTRFSAASSSDSKLKITSFSQQILSSLEGRTQDKFFLTFPTPFHPLVLFITTLNKAGLLAGSLMNSLISDELVLLLDSLYFQCESDGIHLPLVSFVLLRFPQLPQVFMQECSSVKSIVYKKTPHLKKAMRNSDINLFQTHLHPVRNPKSMT